MRVSDADKISSFFLILKFNIRPPEGVFTIFDARWTNYFVKVLKVVFCCIRCL